VQLHFSVPRVPLAARSLKPAALIAAAIISWPSAAPAQEPAHLETARSVELTGTHRHTFTSKVLSREFQISVSLPWTYHVSRKKYPVLYMTDADTGFGLGLS